MPGRMASSAWVTSVRALGLLYLIRGTAGSVSQGGCIGKGWHAVEFAIDTLAVIDDGNFNAIWIRPANWLDLLHKV
jgi:hypothetical protein